MLHRLPVEVNQQILQYLAGADVNNLLSIRQIKEKLRDIILLVEADHGLRFQIEDQPSETFPAIVQRCKWSDMVKENFEKFKNFAYVVILAGDIRNLKGLSTLVQLQKGGPKLFYYFTDKPIMGVIFDRTTLKSLGYKDTSTHQYCFSNVTAMTVKSISYPSTAFQFPALKSLTLERSSFLPGSLKFPGLSSLTLIYCESIDESSRWNLPSLSKLYVHGNFRTINDSIDYRNTTITKLELHSISDLESWSNICNKSIKSINAGFVRIELHNIRFESLKRLKLRSYTLQVSLLNVPELEQFTFERYKRYDFGEDVLTSIQAPKLTHFKCTCGNFSRWEDINTPSLTNATIVDSAGPDSDVASDFLTNVENLRVTSCDWWKYTPNVKHMEVFGDKANTQWYWYTFPLLKTLRVSPPPDCTDAFKSFSLPNAPSLKHIELVNLSTYDFLSTLGAFIELESLAILRQYNGPKMDKPPIDFEKVNLPQLNKLVCQLACSQSVTIIDCVFPKLETLELLGSETIRSDVVRAFKIQMEAPILQRLVIQDLRSHEVVEVTNFPELTQLIVTGCQDLKSVILENVSRVKTLQIAPYGYSYYNTNNKINVYHDGSLPRGLIDSKEDFINEGVNFIRDHT